MTFTPLSCDILGSASGLYLHEIEPSRTGVRMLYHRSGIFVVKINSLGVTKITNIKLATYTIVQLYVYVAQP